jgi:hypothetical protein
MRNTSIAWALCAILLGACSNEQPATNAGASNDAPAVATQQQTSLTPEQLGELGAQIKKNPNDAQRLLSEKGLNEQSFEQAIRKVAEDTAAAKRYSDSYKKAGA